MNRKTVTACLLSTLTLLSCIQKEGLNTEAAIDNCEGEYIQLCISNPKDHKIQLYVSRAADIARLEIKFTVAAGASIQPTNPQNGDSGPTPSEDEDDTFTGHFNFENAAEGNYFCRQFTVTSESADIQAVYDIYIRQTDMPKTFQFEYLESDDPYHIFYEQADSLTRIEWASGNEGYKLTAMAATAADYPTAQAADGYSGKCVRLVTRDTGSFGAMVNMHTASGNLFIGSFDITGALGDPLGATHFGYPFIEEPVRLEGWYKYTAGDVFLSGGTVVEGRKDHCDIYALFYETDDDVQYLDGNTSFTSDHLILLARLPEGTYWPETTTWKKFSLDFEPQNGRTVDSGKLASGRYKLGIVFASSIGGNTFDGAVGSTMYVDEVTLTTTSDISDISDN